jgi:hypothetical protein
MAADIAQRNPGRNDRLEIGSIDRKFGMRRIVVRFQLLFVRARKASGPR